MGKDDEDTEEKDGNFYFYSYISQVVPKLRVFLLFIPILVFNPFESLYFKKVVLL